MKTYHKYIKKYWKLFSLAIFFLTLEALADLMQPTLMARIVDQGIATGEINTIVSIGLMMLCVTLFGAIAACMRSILASRVSQDFGMQLRGDLYRKIQHLSFSSIDRQNRASLITRMTNDVTQVQNFFNGTMRIFVKAPLVGIGAILMAMRLNIRLSIVFLFILPVVAFIIFKTMSQTFPIFTKMQHALDAVNNRMREYLSGVRVVKAFNRFDFENRQFATTNQQLADVSTTAMKWSSLMNPGIALTLNLGLLVILWLGGHFVQAGSAASGEVIAFTTYMTQIAGALGTLSMVFTMFVRAKASAIRIGEVLNEEEISEQHLINKQHPIQGQISFEDVSFSFSNNQTLKNITFTNNAGHQLGIIGATGSGKTTLVNLLMKFYEPTNGIIKIDGLNINQIPANLLREQVAIVPQKTVLFSGSILENLRWGKNTATLEDIRVATQIAQIDEFIMSLPEGYDSRVGQGGINFSGGQRQRLAIARALIRKPSILILDDSLSAVDAHTETSIKAALANYPQKISMIIIGQKIASVAHCNQILVLDHGEIAAIGTHESLVKSSVIYQEIYQSQIGRGGGSYESK